MTPNSRLGCAALCAAFLLGAISIDVIAQQPSQQASDPRLRQADQLYDKGVAAAKARDLKKAIFLYEQAVELIEQVLDKGHPRLVLFIDALGSAHRALGNYKTALSYYQRSLAIEEKTLGPNHVDVATALSKLGQLHETLGEYATALVLHQRSLGIREKALGLESVDTATSLHNLALLHRAMGEHVKALPHSQRSLTIYEKALGPEHPYVSIGLNNLAGLYRDIGEYAKALPLYQRSIAIDEKYHGPDHPDIASSLNNLAGLYREMGEYAKALQLFQRSLAIDEKSLGPEHPEVATSLHVLAGLYRAMGEHTKALQFHQRSLAIREKIFGSEHRLVATSLNDLAALYQVMGEHSTALPLYQRSLAILEKVLGPEHEYVATSFNNLALLFQNTGETSKALPMYQRSLAIREKALGPLHPSVAASLHNLAILYQAMGEYVTALPLSYRALSIVASKNTPEILWRAQDSLRGLFLHEKQPDLAIFYGKQAVNTIQGMRARLTEVDGELQRSFLRDKEGVYRALADLLISQGRLAEAQQVLSMLKEEEFFEFIRRSESDDPRQRRIAFQPHEQPWQDRFQAMQGKVTSQADFDRYLAEIRQAFAARAGAQVAESPDAIANRAALQKTLAALGTGSVMLHFVQSEERLNIIITTSSTQTAKQIPLKVSDLNQQIDRLRRVLRSPQSKPLPAAQELYQTLIAPIAADLDKAGAKTLMLYLDGTLRYIPMAVLHDGKQYLAERYALAVYTEVASGNLTHVPAGNRTIAGLGLTRAIEDHDALPAVKAELEGIVKGSAGGLIPGEVHLDEQFSARTFLASLAKGHALVHVASHFVFRPGTEATSYLLLGDGDRLTLKRIRDEKYDFGKVDLLTLSACETGLGGGRDAGGQEIEGLGVLVQRQGAKGVIATLWPVADESTALFMQHMYRLREQNLSKAEALRQAQIALIRGQALASGSDAQRGAARTDAQPAATKAGYSHPYFWAPFILMGNWL